MCNDCIRIQLALETPCPAQYSNKWLADQVDQDGLEYTLCNAIHTEKLLDPQMRKPCMAAEKIINRINKKLEKHHE